jgi:excisionase family DNA binding protein
LAHRKLNRPAVWDETKWDDGSLWWDENALLPGDARWLKDQSGDWRDSVPYTIAEKYLGISRRRVQQLIKEGTLKLVSHGHQKRITVDSLKVFSKPSENPK